MLSPSSSGQPSSLPSASPSLSSEQRAVLSAEFDSISISRTVSPAIVGQPSSVLSASPSLSSEPSSQQSLTPSQSAALSAQP
mmetsp:Transcript_17952/g.27039  ORF Transcript_17952/g.27039 Transcript_17952/m.27039 type:complete len:82 (+) Transcript_17952:177-422(+)